MSWPPLSLHLEALFLLLKAAENLSVWHLLKNAIASFRLPL